MLTVVDPRKHLFCERQHLDLLWETLTRSRMFLKFLWRSFRQWALYSVPKIARARLLLIGQLRLHSITWRPGVTHVLLFFFLLSMVWQPLYGHQDGDTLRLLIIYWKLEPILTLLTRCVTCLCRWLTRGSKDWCLVVACKIVSMYPYFSSGYVQFRPGPRVWAFVIVLLKFFLRYLKLRLGPRV